MKPASCQQGQRIGFVEGRIEVPDDFAEMRRDQIIEVFKEKINRMQALVDEAVQGGEGQRSMEQIEQEAGARLAAGK